MNEKQSENLKIRPSTGKKLRILKAQFTDTEDNHSDLQEALIQLAYKYSDDLLEIIKEMKK